MVALQLALYMGCLNGRSNFDTLRHEHKYNYCVDILGVPRYFNISLGSAKIVARKICS